MALQIFLLLCIQSPDIVSCMKKQKGKKTTPATSEKIEAKSKSSQGISPWFLLGGIILLTLGIYANAINNSILTFDDNEYFQNYPEVVNLSWDSIVKYFTNYYVIMYQPLPVLSFALNYHFTGLDPAPMHLINILFHLLNVVLVYVLMKLISNNKNVSLIVALLFSVHPMNVEAVTWISARSSSMYSAFYLMSLIFYVRYLKVTEMKYLLLTGLFFIFSLFSKAQAVTLPVVLLLFDFLFERKLLSRKVIIEKIPFFILSLIFGIITISNSGTMKNLTDGMLISYNPIDIFFLVCYSISFYLVKLALPLNLCAIYVYPPKSGIWLPWEYYASAFLIIGAGFLLWKYRTNKKVLFCAGFFLITIAINIQLIPSRLFIVSERYGYMPYLGLFLLIPWLLSDLKSKSEFQFNKYLPYASGVLILLVAFSAFAVPKRNKIWNNDIIFLTDVINKNEPVGYIYRAYGNRGFSYKKEGKFQEAVNDFTEAIKLDSTDGRSYFNRGLTYQLLQNNGAALADFNIAIKLNPDEAMLYNTRSQIKYILGDLEGSEADCLMCIELDGNNVDARNTLATISFSRKQYDVCERYLNEAIIIKPDFAVAFKNRGLLFSQTGRMTEACADFISASNFGSEEAKQLKGQYCK